MEYRRTVTLKDGRSCVIRNATERDGQAVLDAFLLAHAQTDMLLTYPDETSMSAQEEGRFLQKRTESADEIEILAELDGSVVGTAGIGCVGRKEKIRHRAEFGVSVDKAYWRLGIGRALTEACIECAKAAGYLQMELGVIADNERAISLYRSAGFTEYGRNPKGFRTRDGRWQEDILMRLELDGAGQ